MNIHKNGPSHGRSVLLPQEMNIHKNGPSHGRSVLLPQDTPGRPTVPKRLLSFIIFFNDLKV